MMDQAQNVQAPLRTNRLPNAPGQILKSKRSLKRWKSILHLVFQCGVNQDLKTKCLLLHRHCSILAASARMEHHAFVQKWPPTLRLRKLGPKNISNYLPSKPFLSSLRRLPKGMSAWIHRFHQAEKTTPVLTAQGPVPSVLRTPEAHSSVKVLPPLALPVQVGVAVVAKAHKADVARSLRALPPSRIPTSHQIRRTPYHSHPSPSHVQTHSPPSHAIPNSHKRRTNSERGFHALIRYPPRAIRRRSLIMRISIADLQWKLKQLA